MSDGREVATREHGGAVEHRAQDSTAIPMHQQMEMMRTALTDPNVDPAKAREMFTLMREMQQDARQAEFNRDLIAAKREIPPIYKRGTNTHQGTKYGKMEDIQRVVDPILDRHNLSLEFKIGSEGNMITVTPVLRHTNGYVHEGEAMKGPADQGPGRSSIQAVGSASSYLMRYAAKGALNLRFDGEDDDGAGGRPGDQLNDRQQQLVLDAEAAAAEGKYAEWYGQQNRKDKAWLISSGINARVGGGVALPSSSDDRREEEQERRPEPEQRRDPPPSPPPPPPPSPAPAATKHDTTTPEGWTAKYCEDMRGAKSITEVERIKEKGGKSLGRLAAEHTALYDKCDAAEVAARDRLTPPEGGGLFGQDDD